MKPWNLLQGSLLPAVLCAALLAPAPARALSGNVPLSSEVYGVLDVLNAEGCLVTYLAGTRPITYGEVYRLLDEARNRCAATAGIPDPGALGSLDAARLERDVEGPALNITLKTSRALARLESFVVGSLRYGTGVIPVRDPKLAATYLDGEPSPIPGIKASQYALIYNNEGIDPPEWGAGYLTFQSEVALEGLVLQAFPLVTTIEDHPPPVIHRAYLKVGAMDFELGAGRESLWWGQGRHGGLFLTNNAEPLPMVRFTNVRPLLMPWIFRGLGPFRLDVFLSRLEEDRTVPEPWFGGIRLNIRPARALELGASVLVITGGEGRPDVNLTDFFSILFGENEAAGGDRSDKIAGFDFRLTLPGWQVYGEFGGEDEAGGLPSKMAGLVGVFVPGLSQWADLTVEYADLAFTEEIAAVWYRHGVYTDGYTYKGRILGHHVGGGGRDLYTELSYDLGQWAKMTVAVDLERRGIHIQPSVEEHAQFVLGYEQSFGEREGTWKGSVTGAVDKVTNAGYVEGEERTDYYIAVSLEMGM